MRKVRKRSFGPQGLPVLYWEVEMSNLFGLSSRLNRLHATRRTHPATVLAAVLATLTVAACSEDPVSPPPEPTPTLVRVNPESSVLVEVGQTVQLNAEVIDQMGQVMSGPALAWSSSDPAVATVGDGGMVTAVTEGSATISVSAGSVVGAASVIVEISPVRHALRAFYNAMGGSGWVRDDNWLTAAPLSEWAGVVMSEGKVIGLRLGNNGLTGEIPASISDLDGLERLNFMNNDITGGLPAEMADLTSLIELNVAGNRGMGGPVPPEFVNMAALTDLDLVGTSLCFADVDEVRGWLGSVNTTGEFCNRWQREGLYHFFVRSDGNYWAERTNWPSANANNGISLGEWFGITTDEVGYVTEINLPNNDLGTNPFGGERRIAAELGRVNTLKVLNLAGNDSLNTRLPKALTNLTELEELNLDGTDLCAPDDPVVQDWLSNIGTVVGDLATCAPRSDREVLEDIYVAQGPFWISEVADSWFYNPSADLNDWYGVVAETIEGEQRVVELNLQNSGAWGLMSHYYGELEHLRVLDLSAPGTFFRVSGPIPAELGELSNLEVLDLEYTNLSWDVPGELGDTQLREFHAEFTFFRAIHPDLTNAPVEVLDLWWSELDGPIPHFIGDFTEMRWMDLSRNNFSGALPASLGNMTNLEELYIAELAFTGQGFGGPIPESIGGLTSLEVLHLWSNNHSGSIPSLENLVSLREIDLSGNLFSGPFPDFSSASLEVILMHNNNFTGNLPESLGNLSSLKILNVSGNAGMTGAIPDISGATELYSLLAAGTGLCVAASSSGDLLQWFYGIIYRGISLCIDDDMSAAAYLVQIVQSLKDPAPLSAGRDALLRVFITAAVENSANLPKVTATFYDSDGNQTHTVDMDAKAGPIPMEMYEGDMDMSQNVLIPGEYIQPGLQYVIDIDPDGALDPSLEVDTRVPAEGMFPADVQDQGTLGLVFVPLEESGYDSQPKPIDQVPGLVAEWDTHNVSWYTRMLFPFNDFDLIMTDQVTTSTWGFPLLDLVQAMRLTHEDPVVRQYRWVGIAHPFHLFTFAGVAAGAPSKTALSIFETVVLAHELGHNFGLWHAPCGGAGGPDPAFPTSDGSIGLWGWNSETNELVGPDTPDLMSYCEPPWISTFSLGNASRIYGSFLDHDELDRQSMERQQSLMIWGQVDATGAVTLNPSFVLDAQPELPGAGGEFRLVGRSASGAVVIDEMFEPAKYTDADGASFVITIPVTQDMADLASITVTGPDGHQDTLDENSHRPAVMVLDDTGMIVGYYDNLDSDDEENPQALASKPGQVAVFTTGLPEIDPR